MLAEGKRSFCLIAVHSAKGAVLYHNAKGHGRYVSRTPAGAARKAANRFCNARSKLRAACSLKVVVRECTAGSHKKEFAYKYSRKAVKAPVEHAGEMVVHRYKGSVKAIKEHAKKSAAKKSAAKKSAAKKSAAKKRVAKKSASKKRVARK